MQIETHQKFSSVQLFTVSVKNKDLERGNCQKNNIFLIKDTNQPSHCQYHTMQQRPVENMLYAQMNNKHSVISRITVRVASDILQTP